MVQAFQGLSTLQHSFKCRIDWALIPPRRLCPLSREKFPKRRGQGANRLKTHAASLAFGFGGNNGPWVGTMSTTAPSEGEKGSSDGQHGEVQPQSEPKPFKSIDPSASGEDITVVNFTHSSFSKFKCNHKCRAHLIN